MGKQWPLLFIILFGKNCLAQSDFTRLKNSSYFCITLNKKVAEITITKDSLFFTNKIADAVVDKNTYQIIEKEQIGDYFIIYIKIVPTHSTGYKGTRQLLPLYSILAFSFPKNKNKLYVLYEGRLFPTMDKAKSDAVTTRFENKYFNTWYTKPEFSTFMHYPDLNDANKALVIKVINDLEMRMKRNREKKRFTQSGDLYNTNYMQDNLTKTLINNHFNPLYNINELDKRIIALHINFPPLIRPIVPAKPDTVHYKYRDDITIDEPVGNRKATNH